jgi:hypothetical protein
MSKKNVPNIKRNTNVAMIFPMQSSPSYLFDLSYSLNSIMVSAMLIEIRATKKVKLNAM